MRYSYRLPGFCRSNISIFLVADAAGNTLIGFHCHRYSGQRPDLVLQPVSVARSGHLSSNTAQSPA